MMNSVNIVETSAETKRVKIKGLVFNGGGARGVGTPGVYHALNYRISEKSGSVFEHVETIAGTSVGSLTACLFSVGPTSEELNDYLGNKNLCNYSA